MKKYLLFFFSFLVLLFSCSEDGLDSVSIFDDPDELPDPDSYSYLLDGWLYDNYLLPFNLKYQYRMEDNASDMDYNLVPVSYDKAIDMAVINKYLWFDVYSKVAGGNFLKKYGPRIIHLIGSPAYNPANGTMVLGLAEGGISVTLFNCNELDISDVEKMNEMYFRTIHHEFMHILHQKKAFSSDFNLLSANYYEPYSWENRRFEITASLGFVSIYASSEAREDFVEVIANYLVKSDEEWESLLSIASKGWTALTDFYGNERVDKNGNVIYGETEDHDGVDGRKVILQKLNICKQWMKDSWGIDLSVLREEVQSRQKTIDVDSLRNQLIKDERILNKTDIIINNK